MRVVWMAIRLNIVKPKHCVRFLDNTTAFVMCPCVGSSCVN